MHSESLPLVEKYRPRKIADFAGIARPKSILRGLLAKPRPCSLLFIGPPGTGKTTLSECFADELNAALILVKSRELDAARVDAIWRDVHYFPPDGKQWWVVLVNEADTMSGAAQNALLSHLDGDSSYEFQFGGSMRQGNAPNVIWIFTMNGSGSYGTNLPDTFERRFVSRCLPPIQFRADSINAELPDYLSRIWHQEGGQGQPNALAEIASESCGSVRDALMAVELALLDPPVEAEPEPEPETVNVCAEPVPVVAKPPAFRSWREQLQETNAQFWATRQQ